MPILLHKAYLGLFKYIMEIPAKSKELVMLLMDSTTKLMTTPMLVK